MACATLPMRGLPLTSPAPPPVTHKHAAPPCADHGTLDLLLSATSPNAGGRAAEEAWRHYPDVFLPGSRSIAGRWVSGGGEMALRPKTGLMLSCQAPTARPVRTFAAHGQSRTLAGISMSRIGQVGNPAGVPLEACSGFHRRPFPCPTAKLISFVSAYMQMYCPCQESASGWTRCAGGIMQRLEVESCAGRGIRTQEAPEAPQRRAERGSRATRLHLASPARRTMPAPPPARIDATMGLADDCALSGTHVVCGRQSRNQSRALPTLFRMKRAGAKRRRTTDARGSDACR